MANTLGLYIHIPFCRAKCRYCDFCSFPRAETEMEAYCAALCREIAAGGCERPVDTVFFGGGTPTILRSDLLVQIAETIKRHFPLTPAVEWTAEANPATVTEATLTAMREAGFNRLSLGMQSGLDRELAALGRAHHVRDLYDAVAAAKAAGFANLNLDLMFGIPHQTPESFQKTLDIALGLAPTHLSVYALQIEEGTPFYEMRGSLPLPNEDAEEDMRAHLLSRLRAAGYQRYEISNFARAGAECRHNLRYWQMKDYRGFGIAAHSYIGGRRFYNREDLAAYLQDPTGIMVIEAEADEAAAEYETVMLGLRLTDGIREGDFSARFGYTFREKYGKRLARFILSGYAAEDGERTYLTDRGMAIQNHILTEILDA